ASAAAAGKPHQAALAELGAPMRVAPMKALVFAAGLGERMPLQQLLENRIKPRWPNWAHRCAWPR
ncbi:hypothetical protein C7E18_24185, partial [Stenotrophomonas maltophilia]